MKWSAKRKSYIRFEDRKAGGRLEQRALCSKIRFCRPPRGLFLRSLSPFFHPSPWFRRATWLGRSPINGNPIPCFICLYRRSYPLDRRIIGKTDNNRNARYHRQWTAIADDFRKSEFTSVYPKEMYTYIEYRCELKLPFFKIFIYKISSIELYTDKYIICVTKWEKEKKGIFSFVKCTILFSFKLLLLIINNCEQRWK